MPAQQKKLDPTHTHSVDSTMGPTRSGLLWEYCSCGAVRCRYLSPSPYAGTIEPWHACERCSTAYVSC